MTKNKLLTFKNPEDKVACEFRTYLIFKSFECFELVRQGLTYEEMDSALFPLFLEERKKYIKHIARMQQFGLEIITGIRKGDLK